ncbi:GNAT family N-acetyltransferase [Streptococcus plurextorum]|uniref:GNAT family N-acetyltransferase n=1 Tax=Streptococcus plurextorum TaxID=456876 RepID=UPI0004281946|nr:GNAT family N-acetyltransferase [Streptococcus plurextorum]
MIEQEVVIEEAQALDAQGLAEIMSLVQEESDFLTRDSDSPDMTVEEAGLFIDKQASATNAICLLAKIGTTVIGVLNVSAGNFTRIDHIGEIFLAVRKDYQGYGVGKFLMEALIDWAENTPHIRRLELTVQARNSKAVHLYKKYGFDIEATKKRGAKTKEGEFLDVYAMARLID